MEDHYHFELIAQAITFLKEHYLRQPSLDEIANHVNVSKFHFQRIFKKWAGISPKDYIQYLTLEQAKESLRKGKSTLATSYDLGLSGNSRLHDLFVKIEACTPGQFQKRGENLSITTSSILTPFGTAYIAETEKGICCFSFDESTILSLKEEYERASFYEGLLPNGEKVRVYFETWQIPSEPIHLDLAGTPFQIQVWKALLHIPSANLVAYKDVAKSIENTKAVRAVGTAIGKNPVAYFIPCHRVIKNDGQMGNYRWDTNRKLAINSFESLKLG